MRILAIVVGVIAVLVVSALVVALIGSRLPEEHEVSRSIVLNRPPHEVYATIRDFAAAPQWRSDVKRVELLDSVGTRPRFREHTGDDKVTYEVIDDTPAQRLTTRIVDRDLGYSGSWTYSLVPQNGGTRLTVTENGEVSNVVFRFMSRYVFGHSSTIETYLASLAKHFGESTPPQ